jgi:hypothetical protein
VLVDSMCCVAIPGLVVVRSRLLGPAATPGTVVVALLTDYLNVAERATSSTCQKNPVPNPMAIRLSEHEPTHMAWCMRPDMPSALSVCIGLW